MYAMSCYGYAPDVSLWSTASHAIRKIPLVVTDLDRLHEDDVYTDLGTRAAYVCDAVTDPEFIQDMLCTLGPFWSVDVTTRALKRGSDGVVQPLQWRISCRVARLLHITLLTGKTFTLHMPKTATVQNVNEAIMRVDGVPVDQQRLIYAGHQLDVAETLLGMRVPDGATFHLVLRLGGC